MLAGSLALFGYILYNNISTDIQAHIRIVQDATNGRYPLPANILYYLVVYLLAGLSGSEHALKLSSLLVLTISVGAKYVLGIHIAKEILGNQNIKLSYTGLVVIATLIAFSFPGGNPYLGQIPPNVWHNSTTIFLMPFALALFYTSFLQLSNPIPNRIPILIGLCMINVLIKPSYFVVLAIVYPAMFLRMHGWGKTLLVNLAPIAIGVALTLILYFLIYLHSDGYITKGEAGIDVMPFHVWSEFSNNIPWSFIASFAFPIIYLAFHWEKQNLIVNYSAFSTIVSLGMFVLLAETGYREFHGNFLWQVVICNYFLFLVCAVLLLEKASSKKMRSPAIMIPGVLFLGHCLFGVLYIQGLLQSGDFL